MPHAPPILLVDTLLSVGERSAETRVEIRPEAPFVGENGILDEVAYVEMVAQSIAAMNGFMKRRNGSREEGFLLGVKSMNVFGTAAVGDQLEISVFKSARFGEFGIVEGTVRKGETTLAKGEIKVWHRDTTPS